MDLEKVKRELSLKGYVVLSNILSPAELEDSRLYLDALLEDLKASNSDDLMYSSENIDEVFKSGEEVSADSRKIQYLLKGEFPLDVRNDVRFMSFFKEKKLKKIMAYLLSVDDLNLHYPPMIRFKDSCFPSTSVPWHQDFSYFPHLSKFLITWIPLSDINETTKGLELLEGSHVFGALSSNSEVAWGHSVDNKFFSEKNIMKNSKTLSMSVGDVLVFDSMLVHRTELGADKRYSIDGRWFPKQKEYSKRYYDFNKNAIFDAY
jgi:ectoine hydroxylase-related dioxygenase (phytanoyl-CoA dioxygenase family)